MVLFWLVEKNPQQLTNNKYFKFPLIFNDFHSKNKINKRVLQRNKKKDIKNRNKFIL